MILDSSANFYTVPKNRKYFVGDKLSLSYRSASSGMKENVLPYNFIQNVNLCNIILQLTLMLCACFVGSELKVLMLCTYVRC